LGAVGLNAGLRHATDLFDRATGLKAHAPQIPMSALPEGVKEMPVGDLSYNGKVQLMAFEKPMDAIGGRHHFRIFDTGTLDKAGKPVFAIAATQDIGIKFAKDRPGTGFTNHVAATDVSAERAEVMKAFGKAKVESFQAPFSETARYKVPDNKVFDVEL